MPTKLPRLNVTMTEEQHALLLEVARLQKRSASSYLRGLIDDLTPTFRALLPSLRLAAELAERASGEQSAAANAATDALKAHLEGLDDQLDLLSHLIADTLHEAPAGAGVGIGAEPDRSGSEDRTDAATPTLPPYSNTGVSFADLGPKGGSKRHRHGVARG